MYELNNRLKEKDGFTLMEVVVTIALVALFLPLLFYFHTSFSQTIQVEEQSQAIKLASDVLERMKSDYNNDYEQFTDRIDDDFYKNVPTRFNDYDYTIDVESNEAPNNGPNSVGTGSDGLEKHIIKVEVSWQISAGAERSVDLSALVVRQEEDNDD